MPRDEEFQLMVNERGNVVLPFIGEVGAAGRTSSELEREIQRAYIEQEIYRSVTVNVIVPAQSFFVQGEVRAPQRYPIIAGMTLMQAIAAAGGYTEFADRKRVMLTRAGVVRTINMREIERDPRLDITIESGDVIRVPRSIF
jgi:polysaccharide export outer membrane protein